MCIVCSYVLGVCVCVEGGVDVLCDGLFRVWRDFCMQVHRRQPLVPVRFLHRFVTLQEGLVS